MFRGRSEVFLIGFAFCAGRLGISDAAQVEQSDPLVLCLVLGPRRLVPVGYLFSSPFLFAAAARGLVLHCPTLAGICSKKQDPGNQARQRALP